MSVPHPEATTHYSTLGVPSTASDAEIRAAYKSAAVSRHPDKGGDKETFQSIATAHDILTDPQRREEYDHQSVAWIRWNCIGS